MSLNITLIKTDFETTYEGKSITYDVPTLTGTEVNMVSTTSNNILDSNAKSLTDSIFETTYDHIINYAETTGSNEEIYYINTELVNTIDQVLAALTVIGSAVAALPGGGGITAALEPSKTALNLIKTDLTSKTRETMSKNII